VGGGGLRCGPEPIDGAGGRRALSRADLTSLRHRLSSNVAVSA